MIENGISEVNNHQDSRNLILRTKEGVFDNEQKTCHRFFFSHTRCASLECLSWLLVVVSTAFQMSCMIDIGDDARMKI